MTGLTVEQRDEFIQHVAAQQNFIAIVISGNQGTGQGQRINVQIHLEDMNFANLAENTPKNGIADTDSTSLLQIC